MESKSMKEQIKDLLPNPFAVDYQYPAGPLDLYTEKEMEKFAKRIITECANLCYIVFANGDEIAGLLMHSFGVEE